MARTRRTNRHFAKIICAKIVHPFWLTSVHDHFSIWLLQYTTYYIGTWRVWYYAGTAIKLTISECWLMIKESHYYNILLFMYLSLNGNTARMCGIWRQWHLTLSSSCVTYYVSRSNASNFLLSHFIMYRDSPKTVPKSPTLLWQNSTVWIGM